MPTYMIERELPGASELTEAELIGITTKSNDTVDELDHPLYTWLHSYVAGDKIYCVHEAQSEEDIREHARTAGFPINLVSEIVAVIDPSGTRAVPA